MHQSQKRLIIFTAGYHFPEDVSQTFTKIKRNPREVLLHCGNELILSEYTSNLESEFDLIFMKILVNRYYLLTFILACNWIKKLFYKFVWGKHGRCLFKKETGLRNFSALVIDGNKMLSTDFSVGYSVPFSKLR